ncbi:MAG: hypothetical protein Q7J80_04030 [Anaerolineales bacterium]|nr:hypothetical protein [Anaerolineales bacterium]HLA87184.1 hypothetical protein [Anaerolineales bacterium]
MEITPDTSGYMIAGYIITFLTLGIYIFSIYQRNKNLKRDLETLKSFEPKQTKKK